MANQLTNFNISVTLTIQDDVTLAETTSTDSEDFTGDMLDFLNEAYITTTHQRLYQSNLDLDGDTPAEAALQVILYAVHSSISRLLDQKIAEQVALETGDTHSDRLKAYLHPDKVTAVFPSHTT